MLKRTASLALLLTIVTLAALVGAQRADAALTLHMDDGLDWGFVEDVAGNRPAAGENVTTTLKFGVGVPGHAGYSRRRVAARGLMTGPTQTLDFGSNPDDGAVQVTIPQFPFFGIRYGSASVSTNGWIAFGAPAWDYMDNSQLTDSRGFNKVVGQFVRGVMPYWGDLDTNAGGTGPGIVKVVTDGARKWVAVQWDVGECCTSEAPRRVFQAVLFRDGQIRFDYVSSTAPDNDPAPGFIGLSAGTGPGRLNTVGRSGQTELTAGVTLPAATLPVQTTQHFSMPGTVYVRGETAVACTGKTATSFLGCSGGSGTFTTGARVAQPEAMPDMSVLYTPVRAAAVAARAGNIRMTLPAGSSFVSASRGCSRTLAPTPTVAGRVTCATPRVRLGRQRSLQVVWTVPTEEPDVSYSSTYRAGSRTAREFDEALFSSH